MKFNINIYVRLWLVLTLALAAFFIYEYKLHHDSSVEDEKASQKFQQTITDKERLFLATLRSDVCDTTQVAKNQWQIVKNANEYGYELYVLHKDTLINWSSNLVDPTNFLHQIKFGSGFIHWINGDYFYHYNKRGDYQFLFLYKIQSRYAYNNQYIQNRFNNELSFIKQAVFSNDTFQLKYKARSITQQALFSYDIVSIHPEIPEWLNILVVVLLITWIFFLHDILRNYMVKNGLITAIVFAVIWIIIRYSNVVWQWPVGLYETKLFNPSVYASSNWFPSLGDLLVDSILVFWLFILFETKWGKQFYDSLITHPFSKYFWLAASFVFSHITVLSIKSLTIDSQISFDINNIFSINLFTYLSIMVIIIQMLIVYFVVRNFIRSINAEQNSNKFKNLFVFSLITIAYIITAQLLPDTDGFLVSIALIVFVVFFAFKYINIKLNRFQQYFYVIFIISFVAAISIQYWSEIKDKENRKLFAVKLISQNDITTDYFLTNVESKIAEDPYVNEYFSNPLITKSQFEKRLKQLYFSGYLSKYDVNVLDYDFNGYHFKERNNYPFRYVKKIFDQQSAPSINKYFRYITSEYETKGYIAEFNIVKDDALLGRLYIMLKPKLIQDENRFDELLIDGYKSSYRKDYNYSYAVYKNKNIVYQSGNYPYRIRNTWPDADKEYVMLHENGYNHLVYADNNMWTAVISKPQNTGLQAVGLFSFVFTLCTIVLVIIIFIYVTLNSDIYEKQPVLFKFFIKPLRNFFNKILLVEYSDAMYLRTRFQTSILFILFITLFSSAYFTIRFISDKYNKRQTENLLKKMRNVVLTIENENIKNYELTNNSEIDALINQIADLYDTDITLFNNNGFAIASSISKLYDAGIVSKIMPANAYYHLHTLKESQYISNENIASLNFQAAYAPIIKNKGQVLGYLQLPYFNRKADLTSEISSVVVGFINLYVVLFIIIGFIAYLITKNISYPLTLIQQRLSGTRLGEKNEPIIWQRNDEIGELVKQYNQMIEQLEASARKLAETEREGTWREIARQIAHEIKNPLTPMKLSVQHLQRAFAQNDPNIGEKIDRTAKLLVKQIDTLSELAAEFSSFAKMPAPVYEHIDICHELQSIIDLYRLETTHTIEFECNVTHELYFDRSYLNRSIGNLIKNALQAIPENKEGIVRVVVNESENEFRFDISDNGIGMDEQAAAQIFKPYFSTKVSGMGLGLPIVKNMIESGNGKIFFKTEPGAGTTFTILLPK